MKVGKEPRIDLLAYQRDEQMERRGNLKNLAVFGLIVVLVLAIMGVMYWQQNKQAETLKIQNQKLEKEINKLSQAVNGTTTMGDSKSKDNRENMLNKLEAEAQVKSSQLRQIYRLGIPDITIGKLDMKSNNELAVTAYCSSQASFIKYLGQLRELDFIKDVKNVTSKYNEKTGEVNFNLTLVWEVK